MKKYKILKWGNIIESSIPGGYAGYKVGKIFGTLDCKSGMRMKKENRVFFHSLEDAVLSGYRPCKNCRPLDGKNFEKIKYLVPMYENVKEFYDKDKKR